MIFEESRIIMSSSSDQFQLVTRSANKTIRAKTSQYIVSAKPESCELAPNEDNFTIARRSCLASDTRSYLFDNFRSRHVCLTHFLPCADFVVCAHLSVTLVTALDILHHWSRALNKH